ncbi:MAG TPA: XdhC family protein [Devosiaceae bacterium]|jgi:xanthine dehydrogenase accessory factor|nr:XdhC family protein [Devosiaceae bacterium]
MQDIIIPHRAAPTLSASQAEIRGESGEIFDLLQLGLNAGIPHALVTLIEVEGGSSRAIGAQMAVLADGRYCGYLSGGCIEAAVAAEAMQAIEAGENRILRFGVGSPFFDIRLPCGGSIEVHVHVNLAADIVQSIAELLRQRTAFGLELTPSTGGAQLIASMAPGSRTGWSDDAFLRCYSPVTRLLLIGRGVELESMARMGAAAGLDLVAFCVDDFSAATAERFGAATERLLTPADAPPLPIDPWTAVVFLFHDRDWEAGLLGAALSGDAFFIGALGSRRAHAVRRDRLLAAGVSGASIGRIRGPIGLFGPTRDANALAISILADVTHSRLEFDQV